MRKHLIIEGMDGSGKDTLIGQLTADPTFAHYVVHQRASTSLGGPVPDLKSWVERDCDRLLASDSTDDSLGISWIYNRHPLVSERIYGRYRRPIRPTQDGFEYGNTWWVNAARWMAARSLLVIVQPPFAAVDNVLRAQGDKAHMPGVYTNRLMLYSEYAEFVWPGKTIRYDRTRESVADLIKTIKLASE